MGLDNLNVLTHYLAICSRLFIFYIIYNNIIKLFKFVNDIYFDKEIIYFSKVIFNLRLKI